MLQATLTPLQRIQALPCYQHAPQITQSSAQVSFLPSHTALLTSVVLWRRLFLQKTVIHVRVVVDDVTPLRLVLALRAPPVEVHLAARQQNRYRGRGDRRLAGPPRLRPRTMNQSLGSVGNY